MSSRLRSLNSTKISFFAFQDIITSVSGILILVTLLLATELDRSPSATTHKGSPELELKLSEILREQSEVDTQNAKLRAVLAAAETAPAAEKIESDIVRLRAQLDEEKNKNASVAEQLAASQSATEARDRTLGLTDLKVEIQRVIEEAASVAREDRKVRETMADLEKRVASDQAKLLKLREREGKLWLIPDKSSTTKEPILTTVSRKGVKVERFDHPNQAKEFDKSSAPAAFDSYLGGAKPVDQYVVFLIRPSGIELFEHLVKLARDKGFEVGFDALEEDKDVYFSTPPIVDENTPAERHTGPSGPVGAGGNSSPSGGNSAASSESTRDRANAGGPAGATGNAAGTNPGRAAGTGTGTKPNASAGNGSGAASASAAAREEGGETGTGDDSSFSTPQEKSPPKSSTMPARSSPPKATSWWQRFLEWIGLK